ncbi:MAG TPA: dipeptide epimerase, partial [Candidatus Limnocylindrales bacterium]|nr:dipeptide epimerase [Candidatus Limnocylindrales bacterium]
VTLELATRTFRLPFRDPFRIARSSEDAGRDATTVLVELRSSARADLSGIGEGFPDAYYGETPDTVALVVRHLLDAVAPLEERLVAGSADDARAALDDAADAMAAAIRWNGAAKCALDIALHDLVGRAHGLAVVDLLGLSRIIPPTDFTLGLDEPSVVAERARRAARFPALKIKVGGPADLATLEAVRSVYDGPIRVDANTGWSPDGAAGLLDALVGLGVELIEQPFPPRRLEWLRALQSVSPVPIVADESAVVDEDLDALVGVVAGVNVKLAKCGGIGPARRMLERARSLGFRTFLGCMEETSVGIAASAAVASLADWVDLDGCLLIADDPATGLELDPDCRWMLPETPGLGVLAAL